MVDADKTALSETDVVRRAEFVVEADVDGEIVVLNPDTGACYGLDAIATQIWTSLAEPGSVRGICARLLERYDVDRATCEAQVLDLIEQLRGEGVIERCEAPAP
jgi:ornithine carbamoyltransferase